MYCQPYWSVFSYDSYITKHSHQCKNIKITLKKLWKLALIEKSLNHSFGTFQLVQVLSDCFFFLCVSGIVQG